MNYLKLTTSPQSVIIIPILLIMKAETSMYKQVDKITQLPSDRAPQRLSANSITITNYIVLIILF